jgi:hypothetical protein
MTGELSAMAARAVVEGFGVALAVVFCVLLVALGIEFIRRLSAS